MGSYTTKLALTILALVLPLVLAVSSVQAQTATPTMTPPPDASPTPSPSPTLNIFNAGPLATFEPPLGVPNIPTPFPLPDVDHLLDVSPIWAYDHVAPAVSAFQTIFILANKHKAVTAFVILAPIVLVVCVVSSLVMSRGVKNL